MALAPQPDDAEPNDLLGRWLAHHEHTGTDEPTPEAPSDALDPGSERASTPPAPRPEASRRAPSAVVAGSAVQGDPVIGTRLAPPSDFGVRRAATHGGNAGLAESDRQPPAGWEPIVMRSARKKAEAQQSKPTERPSRLARLKARLVDPIEPLESAEADDVVTKEDHKVAPAAAPVEPLHRTATPAPASEPTPTPTPTPAPGPVPPAGRSVEETIAAALAPVVARAALTEPLTEPVTEPVTVVQPVTPARDDAAAAPAARTPLPRRRRGAANDPQQLTEPTEPRGPMEPAPAPKHLPPASPAAAPAPTAPAASAPRSAEETIRAALARTARAEPVAQPVLAPVVEPFVEPVVEPELVLPVSPDDVAAPAAPPSVGTPRRHRGPAKGGTKPAEPQPTPAALDATEPGSPTPSEVRQPRRRRATRGLRRSDAARDLVAAKALARAAEPAPVPDPPELEAPSAPVTSVSKHEEVAAEMPGVYAFKPKRSVRRVLTLALLAALVACAYFVRSAAESRGTPSIGLAGIVVLATAALWAIRAGASVTTLTVRQGQLEVVQQGGRFKLDLASQYTRVEVRGEAGKRGWKVVFPRRGMDPFVVDASMVDPHDFMRVLRFFRPQLVHHH